MEKHPLSEANKLLEVGNVLYNLYLHMFYLGVFFHGERVSVRDCAKAIRVTDTMVVCHDGKAILDDCVSSR
jgi:hypothetical protein